MDFNNIDIIRWNTLLKRLCNKKSDEIYNNLIIKYSEKHRKYHNLNHIEYCLSHFDRVKHLLENEDLVEIAIWYHDIIYETSSKTNEEDSAILARDELTGLGLNKDFVDSVYDMIIATKHDVVVSDKDTKYLIDIDLAILGADKEVFLEYEKDIRKEYKWVPFFMYKKKRFEVLSGFLDQKFIYNTDYFREKFELKARANLNSSLKLFKKIYSM
ncbi:MAG: hypothetical protein GY760_17435 [Deltaproteobacteria bacterium]|nr:hypothetical protein [Deltaproteobacteria bacterium]